MQAETVVNPRSGMHVDWKLRQDLEVQPRRGQAVEISRVSEERERRLDIERQELLIPELVFRHALLPQHLP